MNNLMRRLYVTLDLITDDPNYESEPPDAIDVVAAAERLKAANAVLKEINKALYDALEKVLEIGILDAGDHVLGATRERVIAALEKARGK